MTVAVRAGVRPRREFSALGPLPQRPVPLQWRTTPRCLPWSLFLPLTSSPLLTAGALGRIQSDDERNQKYGRKTSGAPHAWGSQDHTTRRDIVAVL